MHEILSGIDDIDWPQLKHAYGAASDTPGHLRSLAAGDVDAAEALRALDISLFHQGTEIYSAAAAAMPFLIAIACEPTGTQRPSILETLSYFTDLADETREPWRTRPLTQSLRASMYGALGRFIALLDDADSEVRKAVADLLSTFRAEGDRRGEALRRRFEAEGDQQVRVRLMLCLGEMARDLSPEAHAETDAWSAGLRASVDGRVRLALCVLRHQLELDDSDEVLAALTDPALVPTDYDPRAESAGDVVSWVAMRLDDQPFQSRLTRWAIRGGAGRVNSSALEQVGLMMLRSRRETHALLPELVDLLDDASSEIRAGAAHLFAAAGPAASPFADRLADAVHDPDERVASAAIWALTRQDDARVVPHVIASVEGRPERFPISRCYDTEPIYSLDDMPGLADVLAPMRDHAEELMPALRRRLSQTVDVPEFHTLTEVLAKYSRPSLAALPELRAMLDTSQAELACGVLGALGKDAIDIAEDLRRLAVSAETESTESTAIPWAYFRVTGDADPLLAAIDLSQGFETAHETFRHLADLGTRAISQADDLARLLRSDRSWWDSWTGVEAAHAHWRLTGESELCLEVFDAALDPLREGKQLPVSRQVLRYLPEFGPAAARFTSLLEDTVNRDDRLVDNGGWRGIAEDDAALALARVALSFAKP